MSTAPGLASVRPAWDRWVARAKPNPERRLRLFCFPYAGGGASVFRRWWQALPEEVEVCAVQLPGRETRLGEPPATGLPELVEELARVLPPYLDGPFAFFGHSNGALVGFELARALRRRGLPGPVGLVVSGNAAPHLPAPRPPIHALPEAEFLRELRQLNGTPQEIFAHEELMQMLLPVLRADIGMSEMYRFSADAPLDCPILAFGGTDDPEATPEEVAAWREHTAREFRACIIPGDHFFLNGARDLFLGELSAHLTGLLATLSEQRQRDE